MTTIIPAPHITVWEDNSGAVYLGKGPDIWSLGPITPDLYDTADQHCRAWHDGTWAPNTVDGATLVDTAHGLTLIAHWTPTAGLVPNRDRDNCLHAGAGGTAFLAGRWTWGSPEPDLDVLRDCDWELWRRHRTRGRRKPDRWYRDRAGVAYGVAWRDALSDGGPFSRDI